MYIHNDFNYTVIERTCDDASPGRLCGSQFTLQIKPTVIGGVIYRQHNNPEKFPSYFEQTVENLSASERRIFIITDAITKAFFSLLAKANECWIVVFKPITPIEVEVEILSRPLNKLINTSIEIVAYLSKLKHSKVVPVYKGEDRTDPSNHRPISLISVFNRIFEKKRFIVD